MSSGDLTLRQGRRDVRFREVFPYEEERAVSLLRERISEAVTEIESRAIPALSPAGVCLGNPSYSRRRHCDNLAIEAIEQPAISSPMLRREETISASAAVPAEISTSGSLARTSMQTSACFSRFRMAIRAEVQRQSLRQADFIV